MKIKINGKEYLANDKQTILDVAKANDIYIPTLCHSQICQGIENNNASCRVCVVEIVGRKNLAPACATPVAEGCEVLTTSLKAVQARRANLQLILGNHPFDCLQCDRNKNCELQDLASEMNIRDVPYRGVMSQDNVVKLTQSLQRNPSKCILCGRCVTVCSEMQSVGALSATLRGFDTIVTSAFDKPLNETNCTNCGQCVLVCPTGALTENNQVDEVLRELAKSSRYAIIQTAPATRVSLAEEFACDIGTISTGKMVAALKALGFKKVFDTNFTADLTTLEETHEFVKRLQAKKDLPLFTSCCPAWVKFVEHEYPDMLSHLSTCRSPQQMMGSLIKHYYAQKIGIPSQQIYSVSLMPCLAKKFEASRPEFQENGQHDVDVVLSVRELAQMIKQVGIKFDALQEEAFDDPLGEETGSGVIFGNSGGVFESVARTASYWLTGQVPEIRFEAVRGYEGIRFASLDLNGIPLRLAIASGLANARKIIEGIKSGEFALDAVEIMACPGGCIDGGGQPIHRKTPRQQVIEKRTKAIYAIDEKTNTRISVDNQQVQKLYQEYLSEIGSEKAHHLLHTHYISRK